LKEQFLLPISSTCIQELENENLSTKVIHVSTAALCQHWLVANAGFVVKTLLHNSASRKFYT